MFVSNTAGNLLLAFVEVSATATLSASLSDTAGNTWTLITTVTNGPTWVQGVYAASNRNASAGKNTVTATFTLSGAALVRLWIAEYNSSAITANATAASGTSPLSTTVSSSVGALVVACCLCLSPSTIQPGAGYSGRKTDAFMLIEDGTSSGSTAAPSFNVVAGGATIIALSIGSGAVVVQPQVWACII